jgi:ketosteroid isomerase-like protein
MNERNADTTGTALEAFRRYAEAFRSLDPRRVARHFAEPALMIVPDRVTAFPNATAVEDAYGRVMAELPARGYAMTEFADLAERRLSDDLSQITGNSVWKTAEGADIQSFGITYTFRRTSGTWQIVVAAIHDPERADSNKRR